MDTTSNLTVSGSAKSLTKGLSLVDIVANSEKPLRLTDLVQSTGLPRPTAVRLLDVLCQADVLQIDPDGVYMLGPRVAGWGQAFLDRLDVRRYAAEFIEQLVEISGETCFLGVLDGNSVLYIAAENSPQAVRPAARVGSRNPLHCTAIGKALMAARSAEERAALLTEPLVRRTPNTIVDRAVLDEQLAIVQERGYSVDEVENEEGVRCVAAPVRDHRGATVAAISVSAPAYRFSTADLTRLAPKVVHAAAELSTRLGFRGTPPSGR
jgi:DNA-binding IclR family transcriptional regulator